MNKLIENELVFLIFVVKNDGLDYLELVIFDLFFSGEIGERDVIYVFNICYIVLLEKVFLLFEEVIVGIDVGMFVDFV